MKKIINNLLNKINTKKLLPYFTGVAGIFVIIAIVIVLNIIAGQLRFLRKDCTEEKLYTLSKGTKSLLAELPRKVTLKLYFSKSAPNTPNSIKQYAQRIKDMLREYKTYGKGNIVFEIFDPKPDSDEEEWARRYGLTPQGLSFMGENSLYLGVVAVVGDRDKPIPFLQPNMEPQLEYLLTRLIYEVLQTSKPKVGILSWLPVMGVPGMPYQSPQGGPSKWVVIRELENLYEPEVISMEATEIPEDINMVVVIHPKEIGDKTLFALDQFVLRGGRLLAFLDPMCITEGELMPQQNQFAAMNASSDLNKLTKAWGYTMPERKVVGDLNAATQISGPRGQGQQSIAVLTLRGKQIDRNDTASSSLELIMAPFSGFFEGSPADGLTATNLITTSRESGTLDTYQALANVNVESMNRRSRLPIAMRLMGKFKSAFPDGLAGDENEEKKEGLKEAEEEGLVVLVGDADMLFDRFAVQNIQIFGQSLAQRRNDNIDLLLNLTEQLTGSEKLIGLRSRGRYERPFDRVKELEKNAQQKWQAEEKVIQEKLQEAQRRVNELQSAKTEQQRYFLSPEQKKEIKKFRKEEQLARRQLKEVRKNLRRDIEKLGTKIKVINIAGIPFLVAIFGIVHGLRRRKNATLKK